MSWPSGLTMPGAAQRAGTADDAGLAARAAEAAPTGRGSDYARLARAVRRAGLMDPRTGNYAWRMAVTTFLLASGWAAFVLTGNSWWQLAMAVFLAVMFTQVGFLGHDAGHRQICAARRPATSSACCWAISASASAAAGG